MDVQVSFRQNAVDTGRDGDAAGTAYEGQRKQNAEFGGRHF